LYVLCLTDIIIGADYRLYRPVTGPQGSRRLRLSDFNTIGT